MKKGLTIIFLCISLLSCTSLGYNYTPNEFIDEYSKTVKYFDEVLSSEIGRFKLGKLRRKFIYLKKQLHKNNENYERLDKSLVVVYDREIDRYLMIIEDLKD